MLAMWLIAIDQPDPVAPQSIEALAGFFAGFFALPALVAIWARTARKRITTNGVGRSIRRFNRVVFFARWALLIWFAYGLFGAPGWGHLVSAIFNQHTQTLGLLIGITPVLLCCILLWWSEYPYDLALREQMTFADWWAGDLPIHEPQPLSERIAIGVRQQILSVLAPVTIAMLFRDAFAFISGKMGWQIAAELALIPAAALAYILSPPVLRWLYGAVPLTDPDLLPRLQAVCRRHGLGCRQIFFWPTGHSHANAQVIGLLPGFRYVFLSDRLLETMSDEQIEACFAHEVGHVVHRHLAWLVVFTIVMMLASAAAGEGLRRFVHYNLRLTPDQASYVALAYSAFSFLVTLYLLGALMRRLERQADVFAARSFEQSDAMTMSAAAVGPRGAAILGSALERVAYVNNIPREQRDFFHPSIARRVALLEELSGDARLTSDFDGRMTRLYGTILLALAAFAALLFTSV